MFFLQNLIPVTFIVISVFVVRMMAENNKLPDLEITLDRYEKTVTMLETPKPEFVISSMGKQYLSSIFFSFFIFSIKIQKHVNF